MRQTDLRGSIRLHEFSLTSTALRAVYYHDDYPAFELSNSWEDTGPEIQKSYVVQTSTSPIERCVLMTTDPGDLVLDPTCGSGTTAYLAEQWGRRWITIDTSRVALALARARIMGARYPLLPAGRQPGWAAEGSRNPPPGNLRRPPPTATSGRGSSMSAFPTITLRDIANNAEIDVIWGQLPADS